MLADCGKGLLHLIVPPAISDVSVLVLWQCSSAEPASVFGQHLGEEGGGPSVLHYFQAA